MNDTMPERGALREDSAGHAIMDAFQKLTDELAATKRREADLAETVSRLVDQRDAEHCHRLLLEARPTPPAIPELAYCSKCGKRLVRTATGRVEINEYDGDIEYRHFRLRCPSWRIWDWLKDNGHTNTTTRVYERTKDQKQRVSEEGHRRATINRDTKISKLQGRIRELEDFYEAAERRDMAQESFDLAQEQFERASSDYATPEERADYGRRMNTRDAAWLELVTANHAYDMALNLAEECE